MRAEGARQDTRLKLAQKQEEELREFKPCETMKDFVKCCHSDEAEHSRFCTERCVATTTGNRAQLWHGDTDDGSRKQRHVFEIKVVFVGVKPLPPPLTGTATGTLLNPRAFVPSERPNS